MSYSSPITHSPRSRPLEEMFSAEDLAAIDKIVKSNRKITVMGLLNTGARGIGKLFRNVGNTLKIVKTEKADPTSNATPESEAPPVETPKIKAPPYDESELNSPAYKRFEKKDSAARKAHHSKHLSKFPEDIEAQYNAVFKDEFKKEYISNRKLGISVAASCRLANGQAHSTVSSKYEGSPDLACSLYGHAMMLCDLKTVFKENSFSITYTRMTKDPVELPPKPAKPVKTAKPAKPAKPAKQKKEAKKPARSISSLLFSREKTSARSLLNRLTGYHYASVNLTTMENAVPTGENSNNGVLLHTYTRTSK